MLDIDELQHENYEACLASNFICENCKFHYIGKYDEVNTCIFECFIYDYSKDNKNDSKAE